MPKRICIRHTEHISHYIELLSNRLITPHVWFPYSETI